MGTLKQILRNIFFVSCVTLDKFLPSRGVPILLYHSIDDSGSPISTSPQHFAWQMAYLARKGWFTMTLDELLALMKANRLPKKRFIITFDDGFRNLATEALPALTTFGFSATVYLATEFIGRSNSFVTSDMPEFPMLSWNDVEQLKNAGWQIESHGHTHTNMPELEASKVYWELQVSRDHLQKHAATYANHFCYPRGKHNPMIVQAVRDAGYRSATSLRVGLVRPESDPWLLERLPINNPTSLHFKALFTEPYSWFASARRKLLGKY